MILLTPVRYLLILYTLGIVYLGFSWGQSVDHHACMVALIQQRQGW